ncbi:restriction endonuclease subunit S [Vibrio parahaemolyticus]|uniref:restriction endonuclease subunit S n=1 Tax=Vibrio parahaemolyticus TaxID=670 RepID=UPI00223EDA91|nr:restriction endonuclease subunit S [Vibrio parahaemolyticus]MDL1993389.1 restriction endonuclease subunit S [Vibrio parahaemolyticus]
MVPNGWEVTTLGEHVDISSGYSPSKYVLAESGSFPFVKVEDMNNCEKYQSISRTYTETNGSPIGKGAVIFPKRGAAIMNNKVRITDVPMYLDTNMMALTPKKSVFYEYLYYTLIKEELHKIADTSTIPQINNKHILPYRFKLPPLPEQRKIAKILSTWDKAISTTEKLIETSKQQKKALMQQLLTGKKRLVNPETGKVFEGEWEEFKLGELFAERVETKRDDLPLLSITSSDGVVYQEDTGRKNTSNDDKSKYRRICVNDIGYNTMRMWQGRSSISNKEGIVSPAYTILIPQQNVAPMYASYLFKLPRLVHVFERNSQGLVSDTWNLKYPHFAKIKWSFPCLKEQQKIAAILTAADKEIEVLEAKLSHFKQEKKALMQQLLTGKRRVSLSS